jgi:energy-converting hydrogenase Eha subunit B
MFTYYWDSLSDLQRFTTADKADLTKQAGVMFQQTKVLYDSACTAKHMYFINSEHLEFVCAPGRKFAVGDSRSVTNANYDVVPVFWAGNIVCSRRASQGVIIAS